MTAFFIYDPRMRKRFEVQLILGAVPIEKLEIPKTREASTAVLKALQWIFVTPEVNEEIFSLLEKSITPKQKKMGRKGMDLWTILVLGVMRLTRKFSYDELHDAANYHSLVRQLIGQPAFDQELKFSLTSLKENIPLLTEDILAQINAIVSRHGTQLAQKKTENNGLKQTATFSRPMYISRLISILPSTPPANVSDARPG